MVKEIRGLGMLSGIEFTAPRQLKLRIPFETFLRTVVLGSHLARLPADERDAFVSHVAGRLAEPVIDYVRLNIVARLS